MNESDLKELEDTALQMGVLVDVIEQNLADHDSLDSDPYEQHIHRVRLAILKRDKGIKLKIAEGYLALIHSLEAKL